MLSKDIYRLYSSLHSSEMHYLSNCDEDFYCEVTSRADELEKHLFNLLRLTTSLKWPEKYYQYLIDNKKCGAWYDEHVHKLKELESPQLSSGDENSNFDFPPPASKKISLLPKRRVQYKKFIDLSLKTIGIISEKNNRRKIRFMHHKSAIPSKFNYIYIQDKHWSTICQVLFDLEPEDIVDIDSLQRPYRKRVGIKDQKVRKPE